MPALYQRTGVGRRTSAVALVPVLELVTSNSASTGTTVDSKYVASDYGSFVAAFLGGLSSMGSSTSEVVFSTESLFSIVVL